MSTALTKLDCFAQSKAYGDASFNTSLNAVASYLPGGSVDFDPHYNVSIERQAIKCTKMGQYYGTWAAGNLFVNSIQCTSLLVNEIPFFAHYGKCTHTTPNTKQTIVPYTTTEGRKPRYKICEGVGAMRHDIFGVMYNDLALSFEGNAKPILCVEQGMGCKSQVSTAVPTTAIYPSSIGTTYDTFVSCTWNGSALVTPQKWSFRSRHDIYTRLEAGQAWYEDLHEGDPMTGYFTVPFMGEESGLLADFDAGTTRTLTWKMQKGGDATKYFEVTCASALINALPLIREGNVVGGGVANIKVGAVSAVFQSGLNDSFTTIPT
jgi:hypothetical protein